MFKKFKTFNMIAHSFGGVLAMEIASRLEKEGYIGKVVLLDSSADYMLKLLSTVSENFDDEFETKILLRLIESYIPQHNIPQVAERLRTASTSEGRKRIAATTIPDDSNALSQYLYETGLSIFSLILAFIKYKFMPDKKVESKVLLCKPLFASIKDIPNDYYLSNYVENVEIQTFEGDHVTILKNKDMHEKINKFLSD